MSNGTPAEAQRGSNSRAGSQRLRWIVRGACCVVSAGLLCGVPGWPQSALWMPAASPLVMAASLLATRTFRTAMLCGLLVAALACYRRRWFCRWICPTGLLADGATLLGIRMRRRCPRLPPLGSWFALLTLGGACLGYPLLLWLDPLALAAGALSPLVRDAGRSAWLGAVGLGVVLVLSFAWPGGWCATLCPLGATQDLLDRARKWLRPGKTARKTPPAATGLPRRTVLAGGLGVAWAALTRPLRAAPQHVLRPPGAIDEARFLGVCLRCGNCVRACPTRILHADLNASRLAGLLAPVVRFEEDYCHDECLRCTAVCPSGPLTPLTLPAKRAAPLGLAQVDMHLCLLGDDRECGVCRTHCPLQAVRLEFSQAEYTLTPRVDPHKCTGCGACEIACPTQPVKAIRVGCPGDRSNKQGEGTL